jgi:cell division control protein 7
MGQNAILIHEDNDVQPRPAHKLRKMDSRRQVVRVPDEEDDLQDFDGEETSSEASEEAEEDVDESVAEDMRKLEESFKGISQRYRLINRIGEGKSRRTL